ncbi:MULTISPECIES: hypothetical protein [Paenibacillus]|jgi:hypothetical protein|uniref:PepSY domain-containing protein n=1 Tax=Paenibacillus odorifer TaxID=189426 RepID=A0A1R0WLP0_9BACL|nr:MULTISPECIES: hypothetical protein [Paenibacillus]ETT67572.1 hypothetical protein C171_04225 [Paenibacillus sp. FSL H8-237]OMC95423.1 hypothetical protein BSO21_33840 [Paenibacillus odorifer]OMD28022.1 hypothetical protein BJP51_02645 [Paenibacillus odorifer]OMD58986.1 hypothetical protein BSK55_12790 [Paenibacillus odorifer]OMD79119.1 hypothetical protein BSK50_06655 [Paenibacillus odorifer]
MKNQKIFKRIIGSIIIIAFFSNFLSVHIEASSYTTPLEQSDFKIFADVLENKIVLIDGKWYEIVFNRTTGKIISKKEIKRN